MKNPSRGASGGVAMTLALGMFVALSVGCGTNTSGFLGLETCDIFNCDGIFFANLADDADDHVDDVVDDHVDDADDHVDDVVDDHVDDIDDHVDDVADDHADDIDDSDDGVVDDHADDVDDHTDG